MPKYFLIVLLTTLAALVGAGTSEGWESIPAAQPDQARLQLIRGFFSSDRPFREAWLPALAASPSVEVREHVAWHPATPEKVVVAMVQASPPQQGLYPDPTLKILLAAARRKGMGPELFNALAAVKDRNFMVVEALAANASIDGSLLASLPRKSSLRIRMNLARNPATPAEILHELLADSVDMVSVGLAQNPACTPELFQALLLSKHRSARMTALERIPSLSAEQLATALAESDPEVQAYLAQRQDLPAEAYASLAAKDHARINAVLADNPRVPSPLFEAATQWDRWGLEQRDLARGASRTAQAYEQLGAESWVALPNDRYLSLADLEQLAQSPNVVVQSGVAKHPRAPEALLRALAQSPSVQVRKAVAKNPRCPLDLLNTLVNDPDFYVREEAAHTRRLPIDVVLQVIAGAPAPYGAQQFAQGEQDPRVLVLVAKDPYKGIRKLAYGNHNFPASHFDMILQDPEPELRAIAFNKPLSWQQWKLLAKDKDKAMAQKAQAMIKQAEEDFKKVAKLK